MFRVFVGFCIAINVDCCKVSLHVLMAFLEFLKLKEFSFTAISNYVSAAKAMLNFYGISTVVFDHARIKLYLRSLQINRPLIITQNPVISIQMLHAICEVCDTMFMGQIYKGVYLLCFFSFLRLSNLLPPTLNSFDESRQLARGDVFFLAEGAKVLVKWSKTSQTRDKVVFLRLPSLGLSPLCPVLALKNVLSLVPGCNSDPLFQVKDAHSWLPLTMPKMRRHFSVLLSRLSLSGRGFSMHSFRRSGASLAFSNNVQLQNIQAHGTWTSDCVWRYLLSDGQESLQVANSFRDLLFQY